MRAGALSLALLCLATPLCADTLRVATYHTELSRRGPGLLLADILDGDPQVRALVEVIAAIAPDVLLLAAFDHDLNGHALAAFNGRLSDAGLDYPHTFAARPNSGIPSGLDLDGNGRTDEPEDAWGYGAFTGQGGLALLSRFPLGPVTDFSGFLWAELPGQIAPETSDGPFPSQKVHDQRRLSSVAHWDVPLQVGSQVFHLLAWHGSTPIFDGPEDLNGRRGADETRFWQLYLDGALPTPPPEAPVVIAGVANIDPEKGDGRHDAIRALLTHPRLQDPHPGQATAEFTDPEPGDLRVDYLLPDARLTVMGAGVYWPEPADPMAQTVATASRHRLVWVDIALP